MCRDVPCGVEWSGDLLCRRKTHHLPFLAQHLTQAHDGRRDARRRVVCSVSDLACEVLFLPVRPSGRPADMHKTGRWNGTWRGGRLQAAPEVPAAALSLPAWQEIRSMTLRGRTSVWIIDDKCGEVCFHKLIMSRLHGP